jgi:hypothetical protein
MLRYLIPLLLLIVLSQPVHAWEAQVFSGKGRDATDTDLLPHFQDSGSTWYSEDYTFTFHTTGSTRLYLKVGMSNALGGKGTAFTNGWLRVGKKKANLQRTVESGKWSAGKKSFSLRLPAVSLSGDRKKINLVINSGGLKANLTLKARVPGFHPGSVKLEKQGYINMVVWPKMEVSGAVINEETGKTYMVTGWCILTHASSTLGPGHLPPRWFYFKSQSGRNPVLFQGFELGPDFGSTAHGWMLAVKGDDYLVRSNNVSIQTVNQQETRGTEIPWSLLMEEVRGATAAVKAVKLRRVVDRLKKLPKLQRAIVSKLIQPRQFIFDGAMEVQPVDGKLIKSKGKFKVETIR